MSTDDSKILCSRIVQNPPEPLVKLSEPRPTNPVSDSNTPFLTHPNQAEQEHDIPSTAIVSSLPLATESVFDTAEPIIEVMSYLLYGFNY